MSEDIQALKKSLGQLDVQRKSLEMEAEAIISELTSKPEDGAEPMGIDTPLVDQDGYPRGDIDIYRARELRQRLAVIRTDRKEIMKKIEDIMPQIAVLQNPNKLKEQEQEIASRKAPKPKPKYDPVSGKWVVKNWDNTLSGVSDGDKRSFDDLDRVPNDASTTTVAATTNTAGPMEVDTPAATIAQPPPPVSGPPFAKVDAVSPLSPASEAGLKGADLIVEFGEVNHDNHNHLRALMPVVTSAADDQREIPISLLRNGVGIRVSLVPKPWSGRGLIGCHIVPYDGDE